MRKIYKWKKKAFILCTAGILTFGGILGADVITAWAVPASGTSVAGNIVVRDDANGNQIGSLSEGQEVTIKSQKAGTDGYDWYEISFDWNGTKTDGWVRSDLINTDGTAGETGDNESAVPGDETEGGPGGAFQINGNGYDIAETIPQRDIPEGFSETEITYEGETVPAAIFDNADLILLYLQNIADDSDAGFFVYDSERDTAVPFVPEEMKDGYVILMNVPVEIEENISDRYVQSDCSFENGSIMAYQYQEAEAYTSSDLDIFDFYYIYGMSDSGESGWYLYDAANGTLQRSFISMLYTGPAQEPEIEAEPEEPSAADFDMDSITRMLVGGLGLFCVLLLVLVIIFSVRYRRLRKIVDSEYDEEDAEETENMKDTVFLEDESPRNPQKAKELERRLERIQESAREKMVEIELPSGKIDLLDLDDEYEGGYDVKVDANADYDQAEPEFYDDDEPEFYDDDDELSAAAEKAEEKTPESKGEKEKTPEYKGEKEETPENKGEKEETSEWDDDIEFL